MMNEPTNDSVIEPEPKVCSICVEEKSQYTCPRCNIKYCSLVCYKHEKHLSCSELFYKDWVMEELKQTKSSREEKQKVLDMISRVETDNPGDLDSDDDDEEEELESRLEGLDLDDSEAVLKRLSKKERAEFEKLLRNGHIGNLVEIWTPWWKKSKELISEIENKKVNFKKKIDKPRLQKNIPDISTLMKAKPSADIRNNIINVIYSYAFVCRLYNGSHFDCPVESAENLLNISCVLSEGKSFISLEEVIENTIQKVQKESVRWEIRDDFIVDVLEDVENIITGPDKLPSLEYMLLVISDLKQLFQSAYRRLKKEEIKETSEKSSEDKIKKLFYQSEKKCLFLLSWCQRYGMAAINLLPELHLEISRRKIDAKLVKETKVKFEESWGGKLPPLKKQLISEIN